MATASEQSRIERVLALLFAVLMITAVFAPAVGATVTSGNDAAQGAVDTPEDDTAQTDEQSPSSQAADGVTADNATEDETTVGDATVDDLQSNATGTVEVVVRVEEFEIPAASTASTATVVDELKAHAEESQQPIVDWAQSTEGVELVNQLWLANAVVLELDTGTVDVNELTAQDGVANVHANFEVETPDPVNVTGSSAAGTASSAEYNTTYGLDMVNATEVWNEHDARGDGAKVAVLDTGVYADHPDIDLYTDDESDPTYPGGWAEFDADGDRVEGSEPYDANYHGTHTSGTVAGGNDSGTAIGVAPETDLIHGKVLGEDGGTFAQIVGGMEWAVEEDADVASLSLGATGFFPELIEPVRNAEDAGTAVIAASGNSGRATPEVGGPTHTPGNIYDTVGVGAVDSDYEVAGFSSGEVVDSSTDWRGEAPEEWPDSYVTPAVSAPGVDVLSAAPAPNNYQTISGTSMATPHVAGVAALVLSASQEELSPQRLRRVLRQSAWKPGDASEGRDVGYGNGIVDAWVATDRVAADGGVDGTLTDESGNPVLGDATVTLDGFTELVEDDGSYLVRASGGEYELTADGFGYAPETTTVNVTDGNVTTHDFELSETFDTAVVAEQSDELKSGSTVTTTVKVARADSITVENDGDYDESGATLSVAGQQVEFGESVSLDGPYRGEVTVTVQTSAEATGTLDLEATVSGVDGEEATLDTGSTSMYERDVEVGVVDTPEGAYGPQIAAELDEKLHARYNFSVVQTDDLLDAVDEDAYDVYVVQNVSDDRELVSEFVDETKLPNVGVVVLDQYGTASDGIPQLSAATGNPDDTGEESGFGTDTIVYDVVNDHELLDGIASEGEEIELYQPQQISYRGSFHTYFEDWDGIVNGELIAEVGDASGYSTSGAGLAADEFSRTVLASSLGYSSYASGADFNGEAFEVLENSLAYANGAPVAQLYEGTSARIDPGSSVDATFAFNEVENYKVELGDDSTISPENLDLYVGGKVNAFGEWRGYDPSKSAVVNVSVETTDDAVGIVELEHTFVDANGNERTVTTRATSVYEPPLEVPHDADSVQEAVDLAPEGATVYVDDGVYRETVTVDTAGVTLTAMDGAEPTVVAPGDTDAENAIYVTADDVTVSEFAVDGSNSTGGITLEETTNSTVRNVTVENARTGIGLDDTSNAHVTNATVRDVATDVEEVEYDHAGLFARSGERATVENVSIVDAPLGVSSYSTENDRLVSLSIADVETGAQFISSEGDEPVLVDSSITNATTGIEMERTRGLSVARNEIENVETGVYADTLPGTHDVKANEIRNATTGVVLTGFFGGDVRTNTIDAGTGVVLDPFTTSGVSVRYNDLSQANVTVEYSGNSEFDARLNYLGERSAGDAIVDGPVRHDPFLTEPPSSVDLAEPTAIGTALELEGGNVTAVGVPGPTNATVGDLFTDQFSGVVYGYDNEANAWEQLVGEDSVGTMDALLVASESDSRVEMHFQSAADVPLTPGERQIDEGWNFVAPPRYTDIETAFGQGSFEPSVAIAPFDAPSAQIGPAGEMEDADIYDFTGEPGDGPQVSAFEGYFVYSRAEGSIPARLTMDPTFEELYERLEIDADADVSSASSHTVDDVLESNATGDQKVAALEVVIGDRIASRLATADGDEFAERGASTVIEAELASVEETVSGSESTLVEDASPGAVALALAEQYDDTFDPRNSTASGLGDSPDAGTDRPEFTSSVASDSTTRSVAAPEPAA